MSILSRIWDWSIMTPVLVDAAVTLAILGRRWLRARETAFNIGAFMVDRLFTNLWWIPLMAAAFTLVGRLSPWRLDGLAVTTWAIALVLSDFAFYWYHRSAHATRLFWAIHNVHHTSEDLNLSTALRLSFLEGALRWPFWLILPLAGVPTGVAISAYVYTRLYQIPLHSQYVPKLGVLEHIGLMTPSLHRVHHGMNDVYLDKNFGGITYIWDRVFGTFAREAEPVVYGVKGWSPSNNPLRTLLGEWAALLADMGRARSPAAAWRIATAHPAKAEVSSLPGAAPRSAQTAP